jgi:Tfp pilus assembly protein PilO
MKSSSRVIVAMLIVVALAVGFWALLLSPKRSEVDKLSEQADQQREALAQHRSEVAQALSARREFAVNYQQLVVLGKAAPAEDDTPSLLVELNQIADHVGVRFQTFTLEGESSAETTAPEASATAPTTTEGSVAANPSPTEVAASTLPLGASIGSAGLAVMPYKLTFKGDFFQIADFIHGLDALVKTKNSAVDVTGRLITVNGFTLEADPNVGFPALEASFSVTTYLVPPGQGITGEASPSSPEPLAAEQVAATTGGTP